MAVEGLPERVARVRAAIAAAAERSGRRAAAVQLVAVSKTVPVDLIRQAVATGITDLGENRVQEAAEKIPALRDQPLRWHLIGHLQTNKASKAVDLFDVIHSVDSVALATLLSRRRSEPLPPLEVLFEVNVAGEATKQGFTPHQLVEAAPALAALPGLRPSGLMTVAPAAADPEAVRPAFRRLRELRDAVRNVFPGDFDALSMGMSHDYEVAIEEGATIVRVGTAIFGSRLVRP